MPIVATTDFANPDPSIKFTTVGNLVTLLRSLVSTILPADLKPYVTGSTTPSVDNQDKVWMRTLVGGEPLGTFVYVGGMWRRQYTGLIAEMRIFFGNPATYFDANGLGISGGAWDGWHLMNGLDGTANLSNKFIIGGEMDNVGFTGYSSGWRTGITGAPLTSGGVASITLDATNTYSPATTAIQAGHFKADGNAPDASGGMYGSPSNPASSPFALVPATTGTPTPAAIPTLPPFYAMAYCQWAGYNGNAG